MLNQYDILRLQLIGFHLLCCEAIEQIYARDKLGRFAKQNNLGDKSIKLTEDFVKDKAKEYIDEQFKDVSPEARAILKATDACKSVEKKIETGNNIKKNTYSAFGVTNPELVDSAFKAGMNSPEFIKEVALPIGLISGVAPRVDELKKMQDIDQVRDFAEAKLKEKEKEYEQNILARGSIALGRSYLKHQHNMDMMRHLEDYGETEWVGQMGRLGAYATDAAWNMTTLLGTAALPEIFGGAKTLEALAPAVQAAAERRVVIPALVKESYDLTKQGLHEKPENVMLSFASGAMAGRVLDETNELAKENPEITKNAKEVFAEVKDAAGRAKEFKEVVNEKMEKTGTKELFQSEDITLKQFVDGAKDVYQSIPKEQRDVIDNLSSGASDILK